jgi:serine beta-lactamase-like protein LACTB, mitochondrial
MHAKISVRKLPIFVFAYLLTISHAAGQLPKEKAHALEKLITPYLSDHFVPGLSLAVVDQGAVVYTQGFGLADVENSVPASADTVYRIASVSKSITAIGAMQLVEAGKLNLDAPIQNYCPDFPHKKWPITSRELLMHQSGIRDYRDDAETINTRHYASIREALTQFENDPLEFEPGTKMQYTSYGYIVVGCVIEGASGVPYADYMRKAVFTPAKMISTRLDDVFAIILHRARGYRLTPQNQLRNAVFVDVSNKPPGSGINSTATDMGNFLVALYAGKLVSQSTLDEMFKPANTRDGKPTIYGIGFYCGGPIGDHNGLKEVGHGGEQQGVSSLLYLLPEKKFGVAILTNLEGRQNSLGLIGLARNIYDALSH